MVFLRGQDITSHVLYFAQVAGFGLDGFWDGSGALFNSLVLHVCFDICPASIFFVSSITPLTPSLACSMLSPLPSPLSPPSPLPPRVTSLTFTQGSGNFDDTIATAGTYSPGPFARTVIPGDVLKIAGTSGLLNIDREYTVNTISSDGNTVTVDEAVITENAYAANKVTVDVHRGFNETFAAMSFTQTVIPAPLKAAGAPVGVNNVEYAVVTDGYTILTNSDVDPMDGIQVGSHIKATSISSATYSATHTDILYRVVGMKIEVEKVAAVDVSERTAFRTRVLDTRHRAVPHMNTNEETRVQQKCRSTHTIPELLSSNCLLVELPSHPHRLPTLILICHTTRRRAHSSPPQISPTR